LLWDCEADTLYLSPLAFPENPYHKLIKNYKLIKNSKNNPVAIPLSLNFGMPSAAVIASIAGKTMILKSC